MRAGGQRTDELPLWWLSKAPKELNALGTLVISDFGLNIWHWSRLPCAPCIYFELAVLIFPLVARCDLPAEACLQPQAKRSSNLQRHRPSDSISQPGLSDLGFLLHPCRMAFAPSLGDILTLQTRPKRATCKRAITAETHKFAVEWNPYLCNNQRTK